MPPDKEIEDKTDDLVVQIVEDDQIDLFDDGPPAVTEPKPKKTAKKADKSADAAAEKDAVTLMKERYEAAQKLADEERAKRIAAEKAAEERAAEVVSARKETHELQGNSIASQKEAAQAAADKLQADLSKAWEDGEYAKASELQRKLSRAEAVLLRLDEQEADYKERPEPEAVKKADTPSPASDPFEAYIANMPPKMQAWFREHPEAAKDEEINYKARAADIAARRAGLNASQDEYYNFVNKRLGYDIEDEDDDDVDDDIEKDDKRVPAAPVSRGKSTPGGGGTVVRASKQEVEAAEFLGMSIKEYKEIQAQLKASGEIQ